MKSSRLLTCPTLPLSVFDRYVRLLAHRHQVDDLVAVSRARLAYRAHARRLLRAELDAVTDLQRPEDASKLSIRPVKLVHRGRELRLYGLVHMSNNWRFWCYARFRRLYGTAVKQQLDVGAAGLADEAWVLVEQNLLGWLAKYAGCSTSSARHIEMRDHHQARDRPAALRRLKAMIQAHLVLPWFDRAGGLVPETFSRWRFYLGPSASTTR